MGYFELEMIWYHRPLRGATVVDIGCGIGRLTQHLPHEPIAGYLGIDVVLEILDEAKRSPLPMPAFPSPLVRNVGFRSTTAPPMSWPRSR